MLRFTKHMIHLRYVGVGEVWTWGGVVGGSVDSTGMLRFTKHVIHLMS